MASGKTVSTTFYILAKATTFRSSKTITGIKATHIYQTKPAVPRGSIAIGVRMTVPVETLEEWTPVVDLTIEPRHMTPPVLDGIISGLLEKD